MSGALLPSGFRDLLPPDADAEADAVSIVGQVFRAHGYERVDPPLLEFEDTLLSGSGSAVAEAVFRMVDPDSLRTMGLRPDMTPQIARISTTRLAGMPRPLRLSYAGPCVTLRRGQLTPDRQIPQAGIELIGIDSPDADAEVVAVAAEAVAALGLTRASFDLTLPPLVPALIEDAGIAPSARQALMHALDRKDSAAVQRLGGRMARTLDDLLRAAGPATRALAALGAADLPGIVRAHCRRLEATVAAIAARAPDTVLTVDPVEFRGWHYHTGVCLALYVPGRHEELGRGGRYGGGGVGEPACGMTLFPAALLRAAPARPRAPRIYLPRHTRRADADALRRDGFVTIVALDDAPAADEAARLGCTHVLAEGVPLALHPETRWPM